MVLTVHASWKGKEESTWSSRDSESESNEEVPVALGNRSCRMGEKKIFSHCGEREMKGFPRGRGQCLVLRKVGMFQEGVKGDEFERSLFRGGWYLKG